MTPRLAQPTSLTAVSHDWWHRPWMKKQDASALQTDSVVILEQVAMHSELPAIHVQRSDSWPQESLVGRLEHGPSHLPVAAFQAQPSLLVPCTQVVCRVPVHVLGPQVPSLKFHWQLLSAPHSCWLVP